MDLRCGQRREHRSAYRDKQRDSQQRPPNPEHPTRDSDHHPADEEQRRGVPGVMGFVHECAPLAIPDQSSHEHHEERQKDSEQVRWNHQIDENTRRRPHNGSSGEYDGDTSRIRLP